MSDSQPPIIFGSMDRYKSVPYRIACRAVLQDDGTLRLTAKNPEESVMLEEWIAQNKEDLS